MTVGQRIHTMRKEKHMTMEELGAIIHVKRATISRYESGVIAVPSPKIEVIAQALGCTPGYLMGWTDNPIQYTIPGLEEGEGEIIPLNGKRAELMQMIREASDDEIDTLLKLAEVAFRKHG